MRLARNGLNSPVYPPNWEESSGWNLAALDGILVKMGTTMVRANDEGKDRVCWGLSKDGRFSIKSTYNILQPPMDPTHNTTWNLIWKLKVPPTFVWLTYHGKVVMNEEMRRRGLRAKPANPTCHHCIHETESLDHLFRSYGKAEPLWGRLLEEGIRKKVALLPFPEWIRWNLRLNHLNEGKLLLSAYGSSGDGGTTKSSTQNI